MQKSKLQFKIQNWLSKELEGVFTLLNVIKIMGWIIVVGMSWHALTQSNKSIEIANNALIIGGRPHLSIKAVKFEETGKYILAEETGQGVSVRVRFEITNTGNSTAKNVRTSDIYMTFFEEAPVCPTSVLTKEITCKKPGVVALVPGESTHVEMSGILPYAKEVAGNLLAQIASSTFSWPFDIEFYYDFEPNSSKGKTALSLVFFSNKVITNYTIEE